MSNVDVLDLIGSLVTCCGIVVQPGTARAAVVRESFVVEAVGNVHSDLRPIAITKSQNTQRCGWDGRLDDLELFVQIEIQNSRAAR